MSHLIDFGPYTMRHGTPPCGRQVWEMQLGHSSVSATWALGKLRKHFRKLIAQGRPDITETGFVEINGFWCDAHPLLERVARMWAKFNQPHWGEFYWASLRG